MLNRIELIGYLGRDPNFTPENGNKKAYATATIATSDKRNGEEITEWNNLIFFGKSAEIVNQYTQKGSLLYVAGKLQTRKYTDKQGNEKEFKCVVVNDFHMFPKGDQQQNTNRQQQSQQQYSRQSQNNTAAGEYGDNLPF